MNEKELVKQALDQIPLAKTNAKRFAGFGIAHRGDTEYLKPIPDNNEKNNLGNLPSVSPEAHG